MPDFDPDDCGQYLRFYQDNANEQVNAVLDSAVALIRPFTHKIISVKPRTDTANVCTKNMGKGWCKPASGGSARLLICLSAKAIDALTARYSFLRRSHASRSRWAV